MIEERLALRIGEDVSRVGADGVWLVELAALSDPALIPLFEALLREGLEAARPALDEEPYAAAWAEGRVMPLGEGIAEVFAFEVRPPVLAPVPAGHAPTPLHRAGGTRPRAGRVGRGSRAATADVRERRITPSWRP